MAASRYVMPTNDLERGLRRLEQELDLGSGFLVKLWLEKDPWSFIIKAHALVETAVSDLLCRYLLHEGLDQPVRLLPLGGKTGKLTFLRALGLIDKKQETFINKFSDLRNTVVHNIHNVRFDFQTYFVTDARKAKQLAKAASAFGDTQIIRRSSEADFWKAPQLRLWLATIYVVASTQSLLLKSKDQRVDLKQRVQQLYRYDSSGAGE